MENSAEHRRYDAMDALRGTMMLGGVLFHAALPYTTVRTGSFQDQRTHAFFDLLVSFLHSFRMPLFLLAAGFFGALVYDKRGLRGLTANRCVRILVPLIVAWLVLVPLTKGAESFARVAAGTGSVTRAFEFLGQGTWMRWGALYHLWFLAALLVLYPLGVLLTGCFGRFGKDRLNWPVQKFRQLLASDWRPLALALTVAGVGGLAIVAVYRFDATAIDSGEELQRVFLPATLPVFFLLGWALYGQADLLPALSRRAWAYIAIGIAILPAVVWAQQVQLSSAEDGWPLALTVAGLLCVMSACMIFGLLGLFLAHFATPRPLVRYLSDASYWIYLVHLPLVIFLNGLLAPAALPAALKWLVTVGVVTPILLLSYHYCVRRTPIGMLLNGPSAYARGRAMTERSIGERGATSVKAA